MPRDRVYDKIVGLSDEEQDRLRKSHQVSKVVVGEERSELLKKNPDVGRRLLEEEIKLSRHNRARQNAIKVRLMEEEIRRADAHWRKSDTITKASSLPSRALEAGILFLAMGSGKAAADVLREPVADRLTRIGGGGVEESVRSAAFEKSKREAAEELLSTHAVASEMTEEQKKRLVRTEVNRRVAQLQSNSRNDVSIIVTPAKRAEIKAQIIAEMEANGKFIRVAKPSKQVSEVLDELQKVTKKSNLRVGTVDIGEATFISQAERDRALRTPVAEWSPSLREAVIKKIAANPSDDVLESAAKRYEYHSSRIAASPLSRAHHTLKAGVESVGKTLAAAVRTRPEIDVISRGNSVEAAKLISETVRSRKIVGAVAGVAGAAALGVALYNKRQNDKKEQQIADYYSQDINDLYPGSVDPSERVKRSWVERRRKYGRSGTR